MRCFLISFLFISFAFASCDKARPGSKLEEIDTLDFDTLGYLEENKILIGNIRSFALTEDGEAIIASQNPSAVVLYDAERKQKTVLAAEGDGPFQFRDPSLVRYHEKKIYVWCENQLKLVVFSTDGTPLQEHRIFKRSIKDFQVYGSKLAVFTAGGFTDSFIEIYDLKEESLIHSAGKVSEEHILLSISACSGGIAIKNNLLLYISPDNLAVHCLNLDNLQLLDNIQLTDNAFSVQKLSGKANDLINNHGNEAFNYLYKNSIINNLLTLEDQLLVSYETGKYEVNPQDNTFDISKRFNSYLVLDHEFVPRKKIATPRTYADSPCLTVPHNNKIYIVERDLENQAENYFIKTFSI